VAYNPVDDGRSRGSLATLHYTDLHPDARLLKRLLHFHGCKQAPDAWGDHNAKVSDAVDEQTGQALREFQIKRGLVPDMICGPKTWAALLELPVLPLPMKRKGRASLIAALANKPLLEEFQRKGRALTGGPDACAAVASQLLIHLGVRREPHTWAQTVADDTEATGWTRITDPAKVRRGDMLVAEDRASGRLQVPNGSTDHVAFVMADPWYDEAKKRWYVKCFDNRVDLGIGYTRNLTGKGYTPMDYALRMPA